MEFIVSITLSLTFGLFWMWWFYRQDIYEKEPKRFVAFIFILSMPLSLLAGLLEYTIDQSAGGLSEKQGFLALALFNLGVVAVVEEVFKFLVVFLIAFPNKAFNEPMDGIVYAAATALGFASFENAFYVLDKGPLILLLRGPVSTLGHVLFSAMWGSALGMSLLETSRGRQARLIGVGLALSILAHATYNILISLSQPNFLPGWEWLGLSGIVFLILLYLVVAAKISQALNVSVFNPANQARQAILRLRQLRQQYQEAQLPGQPAPEEPPKAFSTPRYAPNPAGYQFRGPTLTGRKVTAPPIAPTKICPNCGAVNLLDPKFSTCYNCGAELGRTED